MTKRTRFFIGIIALLIAAGVGFYIYRQFDQMVTTTKVVTPAKTIPAGKLITSDMLTEKEAPRPLLDEDIYVKAGDLAGKVSVVPLSSGMIVYRPFAVPQEEYRLVNDPTLEVVSFPVDPTRAVGGQIQPGHHIDIWELASVRPGTGITLTELIASDWATATLLVQNAPVVDVRSQSGEPVARQPQAVPGQMEREEQSGSRSTGSALQILTVGVPTDVAQAILKLVGEEEAGSRLWVSLAPLDRPGTDKVTLAPQPQGISREEDASMTPSPPTGFTAVSDKGDVTLNWVGTGDDRVDHYLVYNRGQRVGMVTVRGDNTNEYTFRLSPPSEEVTTTYGVRAADTHGNQSRLVTETVTVQTTMSAPVTTTATPTIPTVTPTPEVVTTAIVTGTDGAPLRVRSAPGGEPVDTLPEGTRVSLLKGTAEHDGRLWQMVATEDLEVWAARDFLKVESD